MTLYCLWATGYIVIGREKEEEKEGNQSPKGNIWSSVPLPCLVVEIIRLVSFCFKVSRAAAPNGDEVL